MIAKRIDMRDASKSRATRLAKYVTEELKRAGRVADVFTANCISDDALLAAKEIEICQAKNTRAKDDKTYHLLLSFPNGERPEKEQLRIMADVAAKALGYGECQWVAVVHDDTDNLHMHLIINKIHPERLTIHTPRRDFTILAEVCAKLEHKNSLQKTNHEPHRTTAEGKTLDMESHSGEESFLSYAKKKTDKLLFGAQSWEQLHSILAEAGISLRLKGNGMVMTNHTETIAVKASTVARDFSRASLEKRFGPFVPNAAIQPRGKPLSTYQKTPQAGSKSLYQQYQHEMKIKNRYRNLGYIEWLKREAENGNISAILALRKRGAVTPALINITAADLRNSKLIAAKISHVSGRGTLFYKSGKDVIRDNGSHLSLKKEISDEGIKAALHIAMVKFSGQCIAVNGVEEFKAKCIAIAVAENMQLTFADPDMEQQRRKGIADNERATPTQNQTVKQASQGMSR